MSYNACARCTHLDTVTDVPIARLVDGTERPQLCYDCSASGPNLWMCMHHHCLQIGCAEGLKDHCYLHNTENPKHSIFMNLTTQRIWCYKCNREVFLEQHHRYSANDTDHDDDEEVPSTETRVSSHHGGYTTIQTNSPERAVNGFRHVSLMRMSGDTSDSSDGEDNYACSKPSSGLVGLQNIGNTCYMNAALQALSNTVPLKNFFLECPAVVEHLAEERKPGLSRQYQTLMRDMWLRRNGGGYVTPSGILYGIRSVYAMFRGYQQHDTQEFLRNFMDQLHEELKQVCPAECAAVNDVESVVVAPPAMPAAVPPVDDSPILSSNHDSSEGEYETCDSGVSERSSLSDDTERPSSKRRLSRATSPNRKMRTRMHSSVIDSQPCSSASTITSGTSSATKKQPKYRSIISDIFDGKLLSSVQCLTCDRVSSRVETFQDLSLPIPSSRDHLAVLQHGRSSAPSGAGTTPGDAYGADVQSLEGVGGASSGWLTWILAWLRAWFYGPTVTLHDCLAAFFSTDELKGDNMYSCERCSKLRNGLKYSKVLQLPEVLCIHLKRIRHELMFSSKISAFVSFPLKGLDMRPYLHKECVSQVVNYELFAVICHHGTAGSGHYTCYALNNQQWYEFDDQCVTRVSPETVQHCEAYVLFYRKVVASSDELRASIQRISEEICDRDREDAGQMIEVTYISKQWWSRFNSCAEPGPIDNSDILCPHGGVEPHRAGSIEQLAMPIARKVYDYLHKRYGGCAPLVSTCVCELCQATQRIIAMEVQQLHRLHVEFEEDDEREPTHFLSASWYNRWRSYAVDRKTPDRPGPIDNTAQSVADGGTEHYLEVSDDIWHFLHGIYGGGPELLIRRDAASSLLQPPPPPPPSEPVPELAKGEPMDTDDEMEPRNSSNASLATTMTSTTTTDEESAAKEDAGGSAAAAAAALTKKNRYHRRRRRRQDV